MEENKEDDNSSLIRRAAQVINPKIKKYKFIEVKNILCSEFPTDEPITDTMMSSLSLACSLSDNHPQKNEKNQQLLQIILERNPCINHRDNFKRTPLHHAAMNGNLTAAQMLIDYGLKNPSPLLQG